jgi:hypothetical protein
MNIVHPKILHTPPSGGVAGGACPPMGSKGLIPLVGGSRGKRAPDGGSRDSVPRWGFEV